MWPTAATQPRRGKDQGENAHDEKDVRWARIAGGNATDAEQLHTCYDNHPSKNAAAAHEAR